MYILFIQVHPYTKIKTVYDTMHPRLKYACLKLSFGAFRTPVVSQYIEADELALYNNHALRNFLCNMSKYQKNLIGRLITEACLG